MLKKMNKTIHAQSGHTLFVAPITFDELPDKIKNGDDAKEYKKFWVVKNWDNDGCIFMYLGKGYESTPNEIVVWYRNGGFWSGYGKTIEDAINEAQKDGWMYA
jgi:hypothetical protein